MDFPDVVLRTLHFALRMMRIVSGGQSGVDRAALDAAMAIGLEHGGWCPLGRRAEDGAIADRYHLQETERPEYRERTRLNVRDSDGTLILHRGDLSGGTLLTLQLANQLGRPLFQVNLAEQPSPEPVLLWLDLESIQVLNVAGPRQSSQPGIYEEALAFLSSLFSLRDSSSS